MCIECRCVLLNRDSLLGGDVHGYQMSFLAFLDMSPTLSPPDMVNYIHRFFRAICSGTAIMRCSAMLQSHGKALGSLPKVPLCMLDMHTRVRHLDWLRPECGSQYGDPVEGACLPTCLPVILSVTSFPVSHEEINKLLGTSS